MRAQRRPAPVALRLVVGAAAWCAVSGCMVDNTDPPVPAGPYQAAASYSRQHAGQALLVMQGGQIIYEDDENGGSASRPYQLFSGTKSFNCALASMAVGDGLLSSLDENVSNTITEWAGDPQKSLITVRELLNMTSGLDQGLLNLYDLLVNEQAFTPSLVMVTAPGSAFAYGENALEVFGELMSRKLAASASFSALDPLGYLNARVFAPIGLQYADWFRNTAGQPLLSFGAVLSAQEWIKYGQLLRDEGSFNSVQILPSGSVDQCTTGSKAFSGYGVRLWLNADMPVGFRGIALSAYASPSFTGGGAAGLIYPGEYPDLFAACGMTDHRMYVVRDQNLVIVRIGHGGLISDWDDAEFLRLFFGQ